MPVLRHALHRGPGERQFLMAWASVPDLTVRPSRQTYTHLARTEGGARVRCAAGDFRSDLELVTAGRVVDCSRPARRLARTGHSPGRHCGSPGTRSRTPTCGRGPTRRARTSSPDTGRPGQGRDPAPDPDPHGRRDSPARRTGRHRTGVDRQVGGPAPGRTQCRAARPRARRPGRASSEGSGSSNPPKGRGAVSMCGSATGCRGRDQRSATARSPSRPPPPGACSPGPRPACGGRG